MKTIFFTIIADEQISMRTIELKDVENLRIWKNSHKEFFFYKKEISPALP